jgi:LacI family transcriptional regulator
MAGVPRVILLVEASRQYGRGILRGVVSYAHTHGPWNVERGDPFYFEYGRKHHGRMSTNPQDWMADGIIMREPRQAEALLKLQVPIVFVSYLVEEIPGTACVKTDDTAVGWMAANHFLEKGYDRFAYVGYPGMYWSEQRRAGFAEQVEAVGYRVEQYEQRKKARGWLEEQEALGAWLKRLPKPVAVMACNDDRAEQVVSACRAAGVRAPEELAVLGVDNDEFVCELSNPPLSSISLDVEKAGYSAAALLDKMMHGGSAAGRVVEVRPVEVVERRSTDVLALRDAALVEALRYIREHAREPLQVEDVAEHVGVSRRNLHGRFQRVLGRSVHEEVARVRVQLICRMLRHTTLSVPEIARLTGCGSPSHLTRFVKRHMGTTPRAYRQSQAGAQR